MRTSEADPTMSKIHIVFDGPPGPQAGRFVEVEDDEGRSVKVGEWHHRTDGLWELVLEDRSPRGRVRALVDEQAADAGLWFEAQTAPEAYVQDALRRLHQAIEEGPRSPAPAA